MNISKINWIKLPDLAELMALYKAGLYLCLSPVFMITQDIEVWGPISTMCCSHDILIRDDGSSTEPGIIYEESNLPGPLILCSLVASNNTLLARVLETTDVIKTLRASLEFQWQFFISCFLSLGSETDAWSFQFVLWQIFWTCWLPSLVSSGRGWDALDKIRCFSF